MRRTFNVRFFLVLLGTMFVVAGASHALHSHQVRRNAGLLLEQAARAEEQGQLQQAAGTLANYLAFVPEDTDALARYGLTLERLPSSAATRQRAHSVLEQVLRRAPQRQDVRQSLVRLTLGLGLYADARRHLQTLVEACPDSEEELRLLAWCEEGAGNHAQAAECLGKLIRRAPFDVASHVRLAMLLRGPLHDPDGADEVMHGLLKANADKAAAYLARANYRLEMGAVDEAGNDLVRAQELEPGNPAVVLALAEWANRKGNFTNAEAALRHALTRAPRDAALHLALARTTLHRDQPRAALECLRHGLHTLPGQRELLFLQGQILIQERAFAEAESVIAELAKDAASTMRVRYLEALMLVQREQWAEARTRLLAFLSQLGNDRELAFHTDLALGYCCARLADPEHALAAYRRALAWNPSSALARAGMAMALAATGQPEEALVELRRAASSPSAPAQTWIELARFLLARNQRLSGASREWNEAEAALDRAEQRMPGSMHVVLLRAELLAAKGDLPGARKLLESARDTDPKRVAPWRALAQLVRRQDGTQAALDLLDEAERLAGRHAEFERLRIMLHSSRERSEARVALAALETRIAQVHAAEQAALWLDLAEARFRLGDLTGAERTSRRVADANATDTRSRIILIEIYSRTGNVEALEQLSAELRRADEEGGFWARYAEACRLLLVARPGAEQTLERLRDLLHDLARRRPAWPRVLVLEAMLAERVGNLEKARERYQRAVELGENDPRLILSVVRSLWDRGQLADADQIVRRVEEITPLGRELSHLGVEIALALRDRTRAAALARQAVAALSHDYREQLWLSQVLQRAGQTQDAEQVLRAQLKRSPRIPDVWVALAGLLAATNQRDRALSLMNELRAALPEEQRALTLARCHTVLGQREQAAQHYEAAHKARPGDFLVIQELVGFWMSAGQFLRAEPFLRQLLDPNLQAPPETAAWAQRQLALGLARAGGEARYREALSLLRGDTLSDLRVRAHVLATRPDQRGEALRILTATLSQAPLTTEDRWLLARLYDAAGDAARAREQFLALLTGGTPDPGILVEYIRCLRRWGDEEEARTWTARLKEIAPEALPLLQNNMPGTDGSGSPLAPR